MRFNKSMLISFCMLLVAIFSTTSFASSHWIHIGQVGNKPNRIAYYAYEGWLINRGDEVAVANEIWRDHNPKTLDARIKAMKKIELQVMQVFESPKSPAFMNMILVFDCGKRQYQIESAEAVARNKVSYKSSRTDWQPVPNNWLDRAHFVACEEEIWRPAGVADYEEGMKNKTNLQPRLQAHGLFLMGELESESKVEKMTWEKIWTDGTRPPVNDIRTAKEEKMYQEQLAQNKKIREENKKLAESGALDAAKANVAAMTTAIEGQLKGMDEEAKFQEEIANNFRKHKNKYFGTFKGLTEEQLVDVRGVPTSTSTNGKLRSIVYASTQDNRQEVAIRDGSGNVVGSQEVGEVLSCDVTFKLRVGGDKPQYRVVDYVYNSNLSAKKNLYHCD